MVVDATVYLRAEDGIEYPVLYFYGGWTCSVPGSEETESPCWNVAGKWYMGEDGYMRDAATDEIVVMDRATGEIVVGDR